MTDFTDISKLRKQLRLKQEAFWAQIGVRQNAGSRYELSTRPLPVHFLHLLIIAYGTEDEAAEIWDKLRGIK